MEYPSVLAAGVTFFLVVASILLMKSRKTETLPGPRGLPIIGYLPFLNPKLHIQFTQLAHKFGPIYKLHLGSKLCVVITSPSLIKQVVRDHDSVFANRDVTAAAMAAHGGADIFWSPNGAYWRDMRKLFVREMMSSANLAATGKLRVEQVSKYLRDHIAIGKAVEIGEVVFEIEMNVILGMLWGGTMERDNQELRGNILKLVDLLGRPNVSDFFPGLGRFDLQGIEKEIKGVAAKVEQILDFVIEERMKMIGEKDFLGILLELKDHTVGEGLVCGLTQIKAVLIDVIVGGTDTTATTAEWVMTELLNNPTAMETVQQELTNVVGTNNSVEESHLSTLTYLEAVVKETFRLHPPLPLIPRFPTKSTVVGGYTIPKGTRVFLNMWATSMDPEVWDNPSKFRPDRFLNNNADYKGNSFQYLPFGSGRRVCPGLPLAERMVMFLLATLLHSFQWRLPEGETIDLSEKFGIVMKKTKPLFAIPYKRL